MVRVEEPPVYEDSEKDNRSTLYGIKSLKNKAKLGTKRVLKLDPSPGIDAQHPTPNIAALEEINESPAFNSTKFLEDTRIGTTSKADRAVSLLRATLETAISPKKAIASKATKTTAGKLAQSRPHNSRQCDLDFLKAHDELERAESSRNDSDEEEASARQDSDVVKRQEQVRGLEIKRESMRAAWVTGRHVRRVRVVTLEPKPVPDATYFEEKDDCGADEFQWHRWLGRVMLYHSHRFSAQYIDDFEELSFDIDMFKRNLERLVIVSASAQTLFSEIRRIYQWENPFTTIKWMALYFFLLHISHIMTFAYGYIIFVVIRNYYYPTSLVALREGLERSLDRRATAFKVGELMDRNGNDDWLGPLMERLGPYIQIQVYDLANMLEVIYNFYHFASPRATLNTLIMLTIVFLLTLLTSSEYSMKVFWFIAGITFFVCWPVSSLYPQYRLLVSPIKWAFWDIPTHAEWSFSFLRSRAELAKKAMDEAQENESKEDSPVSGVFEHFEDTASVDSFKTATSEREDRAELTEQEIFSLTCTHNHIPGHLHLGTSSLQFKPSFTLPLTKYSSRTTSETHAFNISYSSIIEMSKQDSRLSLIAGIKKLEIRYFDEVRQPRGEERIVILGGLERKERDKVFNVVLGFSAGRWQSLQQKDISDVL